MAEESVAALGGHIKICIITYITGTHQRPSEGIMYIVDRFRKSLQLRASLMTLMQLPL